ncbi:MAG TPA: hypothetical protein VK137_17840, partial [Planctomycetaceae bacterium]|nr:hypothetical protein [Planctomycetaceae bacterium]
LPADAVDPSSYRPFKFLPSVRLITDHQQCKIKNQKSKIKNHHHFSARWSNARSAGPRGVIGIITAKGAICRTSRTPPAPPCY